MEDGLPAAPVQLALHIVLLLVRAAAALAAVHFLFPPNTSLFPTMFNDLATYAATALIVVDVVVTSAGVVAALAFRGALAWPIVALIEVTACFVAVVLGGLAVVIGIDR